jgi:hypothetical protein
LTWADDQTSRSPRAFRAWPLAWPSPSGPLGRQRSPGSRVGACAHRLGDATGGSALDAGGADPDNARRSCRLLSHSPGDRHTWRDAVGLVLVLAGAAAGYGGDRRRPVARGAVRGSRRVRRACVRRTRRKLPPATARPPGVTRAAYGGSAWPLIPRTCSRPPSLFMAWAVRPGAPEVRP